MAQRCGSDTSDDEDHDGDLPADTDDDCDDGGFAASIQTSGGEREGLRRKRFDVDEENMDLEVDWTGDEDVSELDEDRDGDEDGDGDGGDDSDQEDFEF